MKKNVNVSVKAAALKKDGYFFDHSVNTLYVTKAFNKKASDPMSNECAMILRLRAMFSELAIELAEAAKSKSTALTYIGLQAPLLDIFRNRKMQSKGRFCIKTRKNKKM